MKKCYRSRGVARKLIEALREEYCGVGILLSHPHAIHAVSHLYRPSSTTGDGNQKMARDRTQAMMGSCPVRYVREAKLHCSLSGPVDDGTVSCADTQFWVDHEEPMKALKAVHSRDVSWPFGELPEGHDFLLLTDA